MRKVILKAEQLAEKLSGSCYAILCQNEMNTALVLLACLAAKKPAILLSHRYGEIHKEKILKKTALEKRVGKDYS